MSTGASGSPERLAYYRSHYAANRERCRARDQAHRRDLAAVRLAERLSRELTCPVCRGVFHSEVTNRRYCSDVCAKEAARPPRKVRYPKAVAGLCIVEGCLEPRVKGARCKEHKNFYNRNRVARRRVREPLFKVVTRLRGRGLTLEGRDAMVVAQGGRCVICRREMTLVIDHDHACCKKGRSCPKCVRGLLCRDCNIMLGVAHDDPSVLLAGAAYLARWAQISA